MSSNRDLLKRFTDGTTLNIEDIQTLADAKLIVSLMPGAHVLTTAGRVLLNSHERPPGDSASCPDDDSYCAPDIRAIHHNRQADLINQQIRARLDAVSGDLPTRNPGDVVEVRPEPSALDVQVAGDHYKGMVIQPVEFIEKNGIRFLEGCIIKRAARHDKKTGAGAQDLRKIIHEATLLLELRYGEAP